MEVTAGLKSLSKIKFQIECNSKELSKRISQSLSAFLVLQRMISKKNYIAKVLPRIINRSPNKIKPKGTHF